jgi:hypothetical protein
MRLSDSSENCHTQSMLASLNPMLIQNSQSLFYPDSSLAAAAVLQARLVIRDGNNTGDNSPCSFQTVIFRRRAHRISKVECTSGRRFISFRLTATNDSYLATSAAGGRVRNFLQRLLYRCPSQEQLPTNCCHSLLLYWFNFKDRCYSKAGGQAINW